jgi:hypothetical protein
MSTKKIKTIEAINMGKKMINNIKNNKRNLFESIE